jgi:hypothetical protein
MNVQVTYSNWLLISLLIFIADKITIFLDNISGPTGGSTTSKSCRFADMSVAPVAQITFPTSSRLYERENKLEMCNCTFGPSVITGHD